MTACAAIPIRASPAANIGLPHSAPPEGLTATPSPSPSASRSRISWWVNGACSSATSSTGATSTEARPPATPAAAPAPVADGTASRSRAPSDPESIRCANPVIQAGRAHSSRARAADAMITTAAPSPTGAQSCARSGSAT